MVSRMKKLLLALSFVLLASSVFAGGSDINNILRNGGSIKLICAEGSHGCTSVNKYGRAIDGVQTTATDIWDRADSSATQQIWLAPTAARIHTVVSTSTADDGNPEGAGASAQAIRVWYLPGWDTVETYEDVVINGTAGVAMSNAAVMINRMKIIQVGTTYGINAGTITATAATDSTITAQINIGHGQTMQSPFGVSSKKVIYMPNYDIGTHNFANPSTAIEVDFSLLVNERPDLDTTVFLNRSNQGLITTGNSSYHKMYTPYLKIPGPAIIKFQAISTVLDTEGTAEYDMVILDQ